MPPSRMSTGSPPRRRGARRPLVGTTTIIRITPASAGSTSSPGRADRYGSDHPRVGGEHTGYITPGAYAVGSPPRRRGALSGRILVSGHGRITPASAGSTVLTLVRSVAGSDHPRVGGEHYNSRHAVQLPNGSPPRRRGAPGSCHLRRRDRRITPASAGSTVSPGVTSCSCTDHPRVGGEHPAQPETINVQVGSPPRRRGALPATSHRPGSGRITPASAGSTNSRCADSSASADHPRVGGEHGNKRLLPLGTNGSPPRRRGAPSRRCRSRGRWRITPASAGSTGSSVVSHACMSDHPRVGGEHSSSNSSGIRHSGSPPRRRGARS